MKNITKAILGLAAALSFAACETYEVKEPEYTPVKEFDGRWVCFGNNPETGDHEVLYIVEITNTTGNDADKCNVTLIDCNPEPGGYYYLDALRFKMSCDTPSLSFKADEVDAYAPRTCFNMWLDQGYYTLGGDKVGAYPNDGYKITITDGKVVKESVETAAGTKIDAIEFTLKRTDPDGFVYDYAVSGQKLTGWAEDIPQYIQFCDEQGW